MQSCLLQLWNRRLQKKFGISRGKVEKYWPRPSRGVGGVQLVVQAGGAVEVGLQ